MAMSFPSLPAFRRLRGIGKQHSLSSSPHSDLDRYLVLVGELLMGLLNRCIVHLLGSSAERPPACMQNCSNVPPKVVRRARHGRLGPLHARWLPGEGWAGCSAMSVCSTRLQMWRHRGGERCQSCLSGTHGQRGALEADAPLVSTCRETSGSASRSMTPSRRRRPLPPWLALGHHEQGDAAAVGLSLQVAAERQRARRAHLMPMDHSPATSMLHAWSSSWPRFSSTTYMILPTLAALGRSVDGDRAAAE
jgi:hypothetical protein